jgi:6-phosphogluconolactonase
MKPTVEIFSGRDGLGAAVAERVAAFAAEAVAARGRFMVAIPGGSVVALLARGLEKIHVDASKWHVFWTDERGVPPSDPQSNFHIAQSELFGRLRIPGEGIHPANGSLGPDAAARAYEADLARVFGSGEIPRFDLVLLGIGEDGHVASLFPDNPALLETQRWVAPVRRAPKPPSERITLTLPVINRARHVVVVAAGEGKADALSRVFASNGRPFELPAQRLRPDDGDLRWMLDSAAAAKRKDPP